MRKALAILFLGMLYALTACTTPVPVPKADPSTGSLTISFDFQRQTGNASNQFAVWIEDANGVFVRTLFATKFTASGGYKNRPDSIPIWVQQSGVDGVSGATPQSGAVSCTWDLKDKDGNDVSPGVYTVFVEGTLRWKNQVLFSGAVAIGDTAASIALEGVFTYEASANQPALADESPEHAMIKNVHVEYIPAKN